MSPAVRVVVPVPLAGRPDPAAVEFAGLAIALRRLGHPVTVVAVPGSLRPGALAALGEAGVVTADVDTAIHAAPPVLADGFRVYRALASLGASSAVVVPAQVAGAVLQSQRAGIGPPTNSVVVVPPTSLAPGFADVVATVADTAPGRLRPSPRVVEVVAVLADGAARSEANDIVGAVVDAGAWRLRNLELVLAGVDDAALEAIIPRRVRAALAGVQVLECADALGELDGRRALVILPAGATAARQAEVAAEGHGVLVVGSPGFAERLRRVLDVRRVVEARSTRPVPAALEAILASGVPAPTGPSPVVSGADGSVAVVVAHHRHPDLLAHALDSIVAQDHPDLEIVVVDDGTPEGPELDRLYEVLGRPWSRPIRLVRQENRYLGAARNTGVRSTTAPYVVFVDDDDVVEPAYVSTLLRALRTTGADAVTCAMATVPDDDGGPLTGPPTGVVCFPGGEAVARGPIENVFGGAAGIVRRSSLDAVGGFHEQFGRGHEDWALYARLALSGRLVASIPEPLYRYRIRAGSMIRSTDVWNNMQPVFDAYRDHLPEALREWPEMLKALGDQVAERDRSIAEARAEIAAAGEREAALRAEIDGLRAHQAAMQRSTTWRVGRLALSPLGVARSVLRRVLR